MTHRFDGIDVWRVRRRAAQALMRTAEALNLRAGADTVTGAQALVDALDHYWQVRYGGRVVVVSPPEDDES